MLFSAQRQHTPNPAPQPAPIVLAPKPQKSTLHSFWNLPAPPVTIQAPTPPVAESAAQCEDCDAPLGGEDMDVDMDVEMSRAQSGDAYACNECGRMICAACAVVGRARHCLGCATSGGNSRRWW